MERFIAKRHRSSRMGLSLDTAALARFNDVIDLSIGDTDYVTDPRIIERAFLDAKAGHTHYGDPKGDPELIAKLTQAWQEDWGQVLPESEVMVTASSCLGMALVMLSIIDPGDEVIVFSPYFTPYRDQIELAGGVCVDVETRAEDNYRIKEEALDAAINSHTKAIIFNNPNNPTGMGYEAQDLDALLRLAIKHDLLVIADEIYTTYIYEGRFRPLRTYPGMKERTVTLNSFSKNFLMTGWRIGALMAEPALLKVVERVNGSLIYTAPAVSQRAAIEALTIRDSIREVYISEYKKRVLYAADRVEAISYFDLVRPKGTFYLFPDIQKTGMTGPEFCEYALEHAGVLLTPGDVFGIGGVGHVRMACTVGVERLAEAFNRLELLEDRFS